MIIEIYQKGDRTEKLGASGDVCVTKEHFTGHEPWYASRKSPEKPWRVTLNPLRLLWLKAAKPLIRALLKAGGPVWAKIQAPEKLERGQVAQGFCTTVQDGKPVEGRWTATFRSGKWWVIKFTENPPPAYLEPGVKKFIRAALKAAQAN